MVLLLLLLSALWLLALTLMVSLCIAARNSDLQDNPSTPPARAERTYGPEQRGHDHARAAVERRCR